MTLTSHPRPKAATSRASAARKSAAAARAETFGIQTPRIWTPPLRPLTPDTSLGFEAIEFSDWIHDRIVAIAAERDEPELLELAPKLLEWQRWLFVHALELLPGDEQVFRFRTVLLLIARQNGKTTWMIYLILWRLFTDGARLVLGSAQTLDVAEDTWEVVVQIAEEIPELADEIAGTGGVTWGSGKKRLKLETNEVYKVVPSTRGGGRSKSGDLVTLDELREHQTWDAWAAISKTTMARPRAQVYGISNAGDSSSVVLASLRKLAHASLGDPDGINAADVVPTEATEPEDDVVPDEDSIGIFEWSAPPGMAVSNRAGWAQANPSMGFTITERAVASAMKEPEWVFRTEVLCQWMLGALDGPFPTGVWERPANFADGPRAGELDPDGGCLDNDSKRKKKSPVAVGVDTSWNREFTYVAMAGYRKDGLIHVQVMARRAGSDWVIPYLEERAEKLGITAVSFQANGAPVSSLVDEATKADIPFVPWQGADLSRWTGLFYDAVRNRQLRHTSQPVLDVAAAVAATKPSGDSWIWDRKHSPADIAPLVAITAAVGALLNDEPEIESAYADDDYDLMVI